MSEAKSIVVDVTSEMTAQQIAEKISDAETHEASTVLQLRVPAPRGPSKWVAKIFGGEPAAISRAARSSALVARGYTEIKGEIDSAGDDVVSGVVPA